MYYDESGGIEVGIRAVERADLSFLKDLRNDPTTWYYLSSVDMLTEQGQEAWYAKLLADPKRKYFIVFNLVSEKSVGMVRCDKIDYLNRSIRVGADITPDERGKGIGTQTYRLLLDYCFNFLNMHRVWLQVLDLNEVGLKLYKSVGFKEEGRLRQAIYRDGKYRDYIIMSVLKEEYFASL